MEYSYKVVASNERTIDVEYSNPVHGKMIVGVRKPRAGENLEDLIKSASPVYFWKEQEDEVIDVPVGTTGGGTVEFPEPARDLTPEEALEYWRETTVVSKFQAHYTAKVWGVYQSIVDLVTAVGDPLELAFWEAAEWRRNSPAIIAMFDNVTMPDGTAPTPEIVDSFFAQAGQVTV